MCKTSSRIAALSVLTAIGMTLSGVAYADMADVPTRLGVENSTNMDVEVETTAEPRFVTVDENADGEISSTEFEGAIDADTSPSTFAELDEDSSGTLTKDEFDTITRMQTTVSTEHYVE